MLRVQRANSTDATMRAQVFPERFSLAISTQIQVMIAYSRSTTMTPTASWEEDGGFPLTLGSPFLSASSTMTWNRPIRAVTAAPASMNLAALRTGAGTTES